eukprot:2410460-Pleurochrysis_carterae.AAC.1
MKSATWTTSNAVPAPLEGTSFFCLSSCRFSTCTRTASTVGMRVCVTAKPSGNVGPRGSASLYTRVLMAPYSLLVRGVEKYELSGAPSYSVAAGNCGVPVKIGESFVANGNVRCPTCEMMAAHVARRDSVNGRMMPSLNECTFDVIRSPVPAESCVCKPAATVLTWFTTAAHVGKLTVEGVAPI